MGEDYLTIRTRYIKKITHIARTSKKRVFVIWILLDEGEGKGLANKLNTERHLFLVS